MVAQQNEISSESACLRAENRRTIECSQAEGAKSQRLILGNPKQDHVTRGHQTQPRLAWPAKLSIWDRVSSTWLVNYQIASYSTEPPSWVLGCTRTDQFVPIMVFDTLQEAQDLFDRLLNVRARKAHSGADI